jgi:hypothetical protein
MNRPTQTTKTEFSIQGRSSDWKRGPYATLELATKAAHALSVEKGELVDIRKTTTVTTIVSETVAQVSGPAPNA